MHVLIDGTMLDGADAHCGVGLYLRQLLGRLRDRETSIRWSLVAPESMIGDLVAGPLRQRLELLSVIPNDLLQARLGERERFEDELQHYIAERQVTHYWHPAPLDPHALFPRRMPGVTHCVTLAGQGLDAFVEKLPARQIAELQRRLRELPSWADRWCAPTTARFERAVNIEQFSAAAGCVVPWATESATAARSILPRPYIVIAGVVGRMTVTEGLIRAFGRVAAKIPELRLVFLSRISPIERRKLVQLSETLQLDPRIEWTGYVDTATRNALLCEAAGIVVADADGPLAALAQGADVPVWQVATPLMNSIEHADALADGETLLAGLERLCGQLACDDAPTRPMARWEEVVYQHAEWLRTGGRAERGRRRRKVAYVSPWPPQQTGIADYASDMAPRLAAHADVTVYAPEDFDTEQLQELAGISIKPLNELDDDRQTYDSIVYHVGNNVTFHREIYQHAWERPGVVVLHDFNIHSLVSGAFLHGGKPEMFDAAVRESGTLVPGEFDPYALDIFAHPLCQGLVRRSQTTIVHNVWARHQLTQCGAAVTIPHGGYLHDPPTAEAQARFRQQFGIDEQEFIVTTLGFANSLKRIDVILQAISRLVMQGYPLRLVIGGAIADDRSPVPMLIAQLGLQDHVVVTGYLDDEQFDTLVGMADVVLNLRCPSVGESSGTLLKAFGHRRACIVSEYQQFAELPDDICWKVPVGGWELPVLAEAIVRLLEDPQLRCQMGDAAAAFVERWWSYDRAVQQYMDVLEHVSAAKAG